MLLIRLAGHFETVQGGSEAALEHYLQAYQLKVEDEVIRAHVWRLAAQLDAWVLVVRFFELMTDLTHDRAERFHFLSQRAYVEHEYLGDTESAFSTLKRAVALMPADATARTRLEDWARETGQLLNVAEFYENEASWAEHEDARIALYRGAADLFKSLDEPERAAMVLKHLGDLAPEDDKAVDERIRLLEASQSYVELTKVLQKQSDRARDERRVQLLDKLLALHTGRHGDPQVVEKTARRLLDEEPGHRMAFETLSRHYRQTTQWDELDALLAEQSEIVAPDERLRLVEERIEITQLHLERPEDVYELALQRYELTGSNRSGLLGLKQFVSGKKQALSLLEQVETYLAAEGSEPNVELYLLVEWLATAHLARPQTALNALASALSLTDNDLSVGRRLASLQRRQKKHRGLVDTYRRFGPELLADNAASGAVERWYLELGELLELNVLDFAGAVDIYERFLVERPNHIEALSRLKRLLIRLRDASRFVEVVEQLAALSEAPQDVLTFVDGARSVQAMGELGLAVPVMASGVRACAWQRRGSKRRYALCQTE